jgi:cbb3-type cytochrome oxidase subunit 3
MYHDFFAKSPLLAFPIFALAVFIVVFALVVLRTFTRRQREVATLASHLPLEDDAEPSLAVARVRCTRSEGRHE